MKETLKMVAFDYCIVKDSNVKYVIIFSVICFLLSFIGLFPAAFGFIMFPLAIFSPMQSFRKGDFMKVYGLLPVRREAVTRALFAEIAVPQFVGGLICELCLLIAWAIGESGIMPQFIQENVYDKLTNSLEEYSIRFGDLFVLTALAVAFITIVVLLFYMILETKGESFAMMCCIPFVLVLGFFLALYISYSQKNSANVPTLRDIMPEAVLPRVLLALVAFVATIAVSFLLCELTVKKTATKEI